MAGGGSEGSVRKNDERLVSDEVRKALGHHCAWREVVDSQHHTWYLLFVRLTYLQYQSSRPLSHSAV